MSNKFKNEWAVRSHSWISGCAHDCKYCYAKAMAIQYGRKTAANWSTEDVRSHDVNKKFKKPDGCIELPHSHDISPQNLDVSMKVLGGLLACGNQLLILSKPHMHCIEHICRAFGEHKDNIVFRFTIGSSDSDVLRFWEPNAPSLDERKECLRYAFNEGFRTSVSCEPMLDQNIDVLVDDINPLVTETIWIGKMKSVKKRLAINGAADAHTLQRADALIESQSNDKIQALYEELRDNPKIRWKESIKEVVGLPPVGRPGEDIF